MDYDPLASLYVRQNERYYDDIHFYARLAERVGGEVLELGAGAGRVSVALARRGVPVVGLELSAGMLRFAREYAAREGVTVEWVQADMRSFELERRFGLIIAPFNALMHLYTAADQAAALTRIAAHLEPGGTFAFDLYVPRFGPSGVLRHEGETFEDAAGRHDVFVMQRIDPVRQLATTEYLVDTVAPDGQLTRQHRTLVQRYYTRYEAEWMLRAAGLEVTSVSGSFEGDPLEERSAYMVFQARHA
ncbi:SAM-dependent methyltransferase [Deinobacterium chartae]|uniref:SAM-dependent methyltransferase n=1 Tax=Deinobacterium chartae TaxID=521158 RepID=A0A841I1L4_9DEIO|nr:class I SAM-dependent methyltransferase [Deinobacterium chartae]MBB6099133.1 SAM-dependent methyltransferase [Deinobacterium chartae]